MNRKNEVIAALDLGTTKVTVLVAEVGETGLSVLGVGTAESEGLRKGMVTSIGKTVEAIRKAKHDAEQMSGYMISEVVAGVGGTHVVGVNNHAMVSPRGQEITRQDVKRVLDLATAYSIPVDREVINVLPQQYVVDEHDGIKDPVGMSGVRLDVDVHLITSARAALDNILKCAERSGLQVLEFVANPLASALAVLEDNERELGAVVLDLGGGSGGLSIWANGSLLHTGVVGAGGNLISRDIATGLRTPAACAEDLKVKYGLAWGKMVAAGETIEEYLPPPEFVSPFVVFLCTDEAAKANIDVGDDQLVIYLQQVDVVDAPDLMIERIDDLLVEDVPAQEEVVFREGLFELEVGAF